MGYTTGTRLGLLNPSDPVTKQSVHSAFDTLPKKKQTFIKELHKNGWNKTQAALKAGSKTAKGALASANNWLKEDKVKRAIEEFQALDDKAINLEADDIKVELWKNHLRSDRVSDSNKALELLLRLMGAFKDSVEVTQSVGLAQVLDDLSSATSKEYEIKLEDKDEAINKFITNPDKEQSSSDNLGGIQSSSDKGEPKHEL